MSFYKEVLSEIKRLGFKTHKDFYKGLYILDMGKDILAVLEPHDYDNEHEVTISLFFTLRKKSGVIKYLNCGLSSVGYGYHVALSGLVLTKKGKIENVGELETTDTSSRWNSSNKEQLFSMLQNELLYEINKYTNEDKLFTYLIEKNKGNCDQTEASWYEEKENTIEVLNCLKQRYEKIKHWNDYLSQRLKAYIDYLENGTPLPNIPSPYDQASLLELTNHNIYIAINKKTAKDTDLLELFGGVEVFAKGQKVKCGEVIEDQGISITKAGKWSVLRIDLDLFMDFTPDKIDSMLRTLSDKYNQSILFIHQDVTNTFGFEVYKKGVFLRRWMSGDGEVLTNEGKPLTGEKKQFVDIPKDGIDEESVKSFLDTMMKVTFEDIEKGKALFFHLKQ